jgi:hypothetical protein
MKIPPLVSSSGRFLELRRRVPAVAQHLDDRRQQASVHVLFVALDRP